MKFVGTLISYVDETMDKKKLIYQQNVPLRWRNFEESFCGVIAELLTK